LGVIVENRRSSCRATQDVSGCKRLFDEKSSHQPIRLSEIVRLLNGVRYTAGFGFAHLFVIDVQFGQKMCSDEE
jgi:hypothetical protein